MFKSKFLALGMTGAVMMAAMGGPAQAEGKADRARAAIAKAEGKIQAGDAAGVGTLLPERQVEARHALDTAKEDLAAGRKEDAIARANQASALAEAALGEAQKQKTAGASAAQAEAQAQVDAAQQQAADANVRAANAEQSAAAAAARAQAAQTEAANARLAANAAQVETTVTTENKPTARRSTKTKVVRKAPPKQAPQVASNAPTQTTTTVTQSVQ